MHKPKKRSSRSSPKVDWLEFLNDCLPALVIPVGPRFQADVPEWKGASKEHYVNGDTGNDSDRDTSRFLGTRVWPLENDSKDDKGKIGKGRPDSCKCTTPRSPYCVKLHTSEARENLRSSLGPAFTSWKFDEMGYDVGKSWSSKQKLKFDNFVKTNPLSQDKSFLGPAMLSFPSKTRKDIVSYYLNVYVPKRISMITRSGIKMIDSDDDEVSGTLSAKNPVKRSRSDNDDNTKLAKCHYLTGRR